jgi:tetratricopeptide (TPR) repeat protein
LDKPAAVLEEVVPTSDSEALLDEAFGSISAENYGKALINFQKVQRIQPTLAGIDYLIGYAALLTAEYGLAEQSLRQSLSKMEMEVESRLLLAMVEFRKSGSTGAASEKMADPVSVAESAFRHYAALRPADPAVYDQWADLLRSNGSYRSAAELLHKGVLRSDASLNESYLSAKEALTRLQSEPSKEVPSMAGITSMSGEQALVAACIALQQKRVNEAVFFLERAREFYRPNIFRKLLKDPVFDEFRSEPKIKEVLQKNESA